MSRIRGHIVTIILLGIMLLCLGMALVSSRELDLGSKIYMLYEKNNVIDGKGALAMQNTEREQEVRLNYTLWGMEENVSLVNEELSRSVNGNVAFICGGSSLLFRSEGYLDEEDYEGCLISKDLAYQLFGSQNIRGQSLLVGKRRLTIRGILTDASSTLVVQADSTTAAVIDAAALEIPGGRLASSVLSAYQERYGFGSSQSPLYLFMDWAQSSVRWIAVLMLLFIAVRCLKSVLRVKEIPALFIGSIAVTVLLLTALFAASGIQLRLSAEFAPTRWSDFSYWKSLFAEKKDAIRILIQSEKREPEAVLMNAFVQTITYSIFACGIWLIHFRTLKIKTSVTFYTYSTAAIIIAYSLVKTNPGSAHILSGEPLLWILPTLYFLTCYLYGKRSEIKTFYLNQATHLAARQQQLNQQETLQENLILEEAAISQEPGNDTDQ